MSNATPATRLLQAFADTFRGRPYYHRNQTLGNFIANHLFDDLHLVGLSPKLSSGVHGRRLVVNLANKVSGRAGRRGDGTFGELIPGELAEPETGFVVQRGPIATIMIGAETKMLAKSMIKQIDRVINDLTNQVTVFRAQTQKSVTVGIVGVNHAEDYTSYEGTRQYPAKPSPAREAPEAIRRLNELAARAFDEFLVFRFRATNTGAYPFEWVDETETRQVYSAALLRICRSFEERF